MGHGFRVARVLKPHEVARHIGLAEHGIENVVLDVDSEEGSAGPEIYDADDLHQAFAAGDLVEHFDGDRVEFSVVGLDSGNAKGILLERAATLIPGVLSGVHFITCGGTLDSTMLESHLLLALDDEICGMVLRLAEGIAVDDKTLALDAIRRVNFSGNYLAEQHTRRHFLREHYIPRLLVREGYETWEKEGRRTALDRAHERVREILDGHQPRALDPAVERGLQEYLEMTRARSIEDYVAYEDESRQDFSAL